MPGLEPPQIVEIEAVTDEEYQAALKKSNEEAELAKQRKLEKENEKKVETERKLKERGFNSRIHERGKRNQPLNTRQHNANRSKSKVRARIEHIFGAQETALGGRLVRTIGIVRAKAKIALQNFCYNVKRLATLQRMASA